jgi:hypothetical protein
VDKVKYSDFATLATKINFLHAEGRYVDHHAEYKISISVGLAGEFFPWVKAAPL